MIYMTRYLIVNDEKELYKVMYADLFRSKEFDIEEINRFKSMPKPLRVLRDLHFDDGLNIHCWLPGKSVWNAWYTLSDYVFDNNESYWIIFLNGTLRNYYSAKYLEHLRREHPNVKFAMVLYDNFANVYARRAIKLIPMFDKVFSFDEHDCSQHGLEHIYSTFSYPTFVKQDERYRCGSFFVGTGEKRLQLLESAFAVISDHLPNCKFNIIGVSKNEQTRPDIITYNEPIPYREALQYTYNSDLVVEVLKEGQTGISLRTCEAIAFNKKLLTNNECIKDMPFFDSRFMSVFHTADDIDLDFLTHDLDVRYESNDWFSPLRIIRRLEEDTR